MHADYQLLMAEATRLTQAGDLSAATAMIQRALNRADGAQPTSPGPTHDNRTIDVAARVVSDLGADDAAAASARQERRSASTDRFRTGRYTHPSAGQRSYKLYAPSQANAAASSSPLIVMLHGCTQDPDDFARGTAMNEAAEAQAMFVLYPEQSAEMNPQRCWNWFKHNHQQRDRGEPALLAGMVREVIAQHPSIDPARVYVAGLSAGGAMAAILGETHPDIFAAVGVHSGLAAGAATDLPSAFGAMQNGGAGAVGSASRMPTIVFHGDADHTVSIRNAEQVLAASIGPNAPLETAGLPANSSGRRSVTRQVLRDGASGKTVAESWTIHGAPQAWSGGRAAGSFTDQNGPDATAQMLRFFMQHSRAANR